MKSLVTLYEAMSQSDEALEKFKPIKTLVARVLTAFEEGNDSEVNDLCAKLKEEILDYNDDADTLVVKSAVKSFANSASKIQKKDYVDFNEFISGGLSFVQTQFWAEDESGGEDEIDYEDLLYSCAEAVNNGTGDKDKIITALLLCGEQGKMPAAYFNLGLLYSRGMIGVPVDNSKAVSYFTLAANGGYWYACNELYVAYMNAKGVSKSVPTALSWLELAISHDNPRAMANMADYLMRIGQKDYQRAYTLAKRSADMGDDLGRCMMAFAYEMGAGVTRDHDEALRLIGVEKRNGNSFADIVTENINIHNSSVADSSAGDDDFENLLNEYLRKSGEEYDNSWKRKLEKWLDKLSFKKCLKWAVVLFFIYKIVSCVPWGIIGGMLDSSDDHCNMIAEKGIVRSSPAFADDNIVRDNVMYGEHIEVVKDMGNGWDKVVANGTKGYMAKSLIVGHDDWLLFSSIFLNEQGLINDETIATRKEISEVTFRQALIYYYNLQKIVGNMSEKELKERGFKLSDANRWMLAMYSPGSSVKNIYYGYNRTVLAVILTNVSTSKRETVVFEKNEQTGEADFMTHEDAPEEGGIASVVKSGGLFKISYATNAKKSKRSKRKSTSRSSGSASSSSVSAAEGSSAGKVEVQPAAEGEYEGGYRLERINE